MRRVRPLLLQGLPELSFTGCHEPSKPAWINKWIRLDALFQLSALLSEVEKASMGGEEDVARQMLEPSEGVLKIGNNLRVGLIIDQAVLARGGDAAQEDHIVAFAGLDNRHGPRGASGGVARR